MAEDKETKRRGRPPKVTTAADPVTTLKQIPKELFRAFVSKAGLPTEDARALCKWHAE